MPPAARLLDSTNHPGFIFEPGVRNVFIGGRLAAVVGAKHICFLPPSAGGPHPVTTIASGSKTVLIGNLPAARVGDLTACQATIQTGAPDVLIGG